jgi:hypothetical protein
MEEEEVVVVVKVSVVLDSLPPTFPSNHSALVQR